MSETAIAIAPSVKIAILKHLINEKTFTFAATVTRLTEDQVREVATAHGYPREDSMRRAVDILNRQVDAGSDLVTKPEAAAATHRPATTSPSSVTNPDARPIGPPDEIRVLLNTAKGHPSKRIQNAANRVFDDLDKVRSLLREDQEKHAAKRQAEAAKAAARVEVERLERQLREAKAKLRGGKKEAATSSSEQPRATTAPKGEYPCRNEGCDDIKDTPQGRSLHERRHCPHREAS